MHEKCLSIDQATLRAKQYCSYQERCHSEVKEKLYSFGLHRNDVDTILSGLIEENYLNEQRFAILYAGGKFRIKQWGRVKIRYSLKQKQVSEYCINKALEQFEDDEYGQVLRSLAEKKSQLLRGEKNKYIKKRKLQEHLMQKGFEPDLVRQEVSNLVPVK